MEMGERKKQLCISENEQEVFDLTRLLQMAGASEDAVCRYLEVEKDAGADEACVRILRSCRGKLLKNIHEQQQLLDKLDFVIWNKQKNKK